MNAAALIVAAGEGRRLRNDMAKPYVPLRDRPLVLWTLDRFVAVRHVRSIVLVVAAGEMSRCQTLLAGEAAMSRAPITLRSGGATRQESVRRGLAAVASEADIVIIHDGARPFVSPALIERCIDVADEKGAAVVGLPARDTIKVVSEERWVRSTPDRSSLWEIQTPQAFRRAWIMAAHERAEHDRVTATDDAALVEHMGRAVFVVEGERTNFKITTSEDLFLAEALMRGGYVP